MAFETKVYTDDLGFFWLCRVSSNFDSTSNETNTVTTAKNVGVHTKSSKSNNAYGIRPRHIIIRIKDNSSPIRHSVPIYQKSVFDGLAVGADFVVSQLPDGTGGRTYTIVAKKGEKRDAN